MNNGPGEEVRDERDNEKMSWKNETRLTQPRKNRKKKRNRELCCNIKIILPQKRQKVENTNMVRRNTRC